MLVQTVTAVLKMSLSGTFSAHENHLCAEVRKKRSTTILNRVHISQEAGRRALLLGIFLALAFAVRLTVAVCNPHTYHPDETFQALEPAHRLVFGYGAVTWEWREGIRSWALPGLVAIILCATAWMSPGSAGYVHGVAFVFSLLSLSTVWFAWAWTRRLAGYKAAWIAVAVCSLNYWLIFFAPRTLSEVLATDLLLPGLYLGFFAAEGREKLRLFLAGVFCGLACGLRIQLLPTILLAVLWLCWKQWHHRLPALAAGVTLSAAFFGVIDTLTLGAPFLSYIRYFQANILEHRAATYGVSPWYYYFIVIACALGPALLFCWHGARRSPFLATMAMSIVLAHSCIGHKEDRFLYPALPMFLVLSVIGLTSFLGWLHQRYLTLSIPRAAVVLWLLCFILPSAGTAIGMDISSEGNLEDGSSWQQPAYFALGRDPQLCGLATLRLPWQFTGGFSLLHRNLPILPVDSAAQLQQHAPSFNTLLTPDSNTEIPADYHKVQCWNGVCEYQRPGGCPSSAPQDSLNLWLRRNGK